MPKEGLARFVWAVTAEWLITSRRHRPNGGGVIFARSLLVSSLAWVLVLTAQALVDPSGLVWDYSADRLRKSVVNGASLFGAIFAAAFASFYARFASQWNYVANMYNQIKSAEARGLPAGKARSALAQWKAGFIEDAADLHLATKRGIASTIVAWSADRAVEREFVLHSGGKQRFDDLIAAAKTAAAFDAEEVEEA